jgi:GNAT superfamily N-acetyltransferase
MAQTGTLRIRPAEAGEARAIATIHVDSWRAAYRGLLPDSYLDRLSIEERERQWAETLEGAVDGSGVLVAEDDGRVVGFASWGPSRDTDAAERTGEVPAIYVDPSAIGIGVGRALFAEAANALRDAGYTCATLWVLEANGRARRFYERAGWRWDGTVSDHQFECANEPIVRYSVDLAPTSTS